MTAMTLSRVRYVRTTYVTAHIGQLGLSFTVFFYETYKRRKIREW